MNKIVLAAAMVLGLALSPSRSFAGPPGFYAGGTYVSPFPTTPFATGPTTYGFNYYASPYGYQTYNSFGYTPTWWGGSNAYYMSATSIQPLASGPWHSVYWDPFNNTYVYGPSTGSSGVSYNPGIRVPVVRHR